MLNFIGTHVAAGPPKTSCRPGWTGISASAPRLRLLEFQRTHGILADGIVGPISLKLIEDEYRAARLALDSPADNVEQTPTRLITRIEKFPP